MIRLFHVYYPVRSLVLLVGEALIVCASFLLATFVAFGPDSYLVLNYESGLFKILAVTAIAVLCSYYFDLYAPEQFSTPGEVYFRLLIVLGLLAFFMAGVGYFLPEYLVGNGVPVIGLLILTLSLLLWRTAYSWLVSRPYLQERVYVLGAGPRAQRLVEAIRSRKDFGMEIVGWAGAVGNGSLTRENLAGQLATLRGRNRVDRIIVALSDRRGTMPVRELLDLRLNGIKVEDATSLLEKLAGKIEVEDLHPSSLIFSEGFRINPGVLLARRLVSTTVSLVGLLVSLPLIPFIILAIKLTSPGPIFFAQERVGRRGECFRLYKFRTMRQDAEAGTGAVWAGKNDPRVTAVGSFLRKTRLDEIPQLWNVLRGDMGFVGPRPERPEFVQWLSEQISYYNLRHIIRPGLTGWAQVSYQYGASLEETRQKLQYDLYYIKHMSLALDLFILFRTVKTVLLRQGAQ